jgi:periplasmic divalent cation tolerance protein
VGSDFVLVLTTFPGDQDAEPLAKALVDEQLAACVNVLPVMRSIYRWKGVTEHADERQLVIKTTRARVAALESRIRELHSYDVPEFVVLPIDSGSADYLSWLASSVLHPGAGPK